MSFFGLRAHRAQLEKLIFDFRVHFSYNQIVSGCKLRANAPDG